MRRYSPYNYGDDNPIRFTDPDGMSTKDHIYLSENGKVIYRQKLDGVDHTYVIKTTKTTDDIYSPEDKAAGHASTSNPISKADAKATATQISNGNLTGPLMNNVVEIENVPTLKSMFNSGPSKDNGQGGTSASNNREYGGTVNKDGTVIASTPGEIKSPKTDALADVTNTFTSDTKTDFHDHPSGTVVDAPSSNTIGGSTTTYSFMQGPSSNDVGNAGSEVHYEFARGAGIIYIYNNTGVVASLPDKVVK